MDPVRNPFAPGAGHPPPALIGRQRLLDDMDVALQRVATERFSQGFVVNGLRGVGKTVLLLHVQEIAVKRGFRTAWAEASDGDSLSQTVLPAAKQLLVSLSIVGQAKSAAKAGLDLIKRALSGVKVGIAGVDVEVATDLDHGADDNDPLRLQHVLILLGEAARAAKQPVALFIDEVQFLTQSDFGILSKAMHRIAQQKLPLIIFAAGLPEVLHLAGESYAERLFRYCPIGALSDADAIAAIRMPIAEEAATITDAAVALIVERTLGYPYFLQQWGHDVWNLAQTAEIGIADVERASDLALATLDEGFFRVRYDRCNASEQRYMRALAEFGPGAHRSGEIAELLRLTTPGAAPTRAKLLRKGMIYAPAHGLSAFTVPLFDDYMRRTMPLA